MAGGRGLGWSALALVVGLLPVALAACGSKPLVIVDGDSLMVAARSTVTSQLGDARRPGPRSEARYRHDARQLIDAVAPTGVPLLFVSAPPPPPYGTPHTTNAVLSQVVASEAAQGRDVTWADAGQALAGPHGGWTKTLPCLPQEGAAQGCRNGSIVVRSSDGLHFCPGRWESRGLHHGRCSTYSSGALRYGSAIAAAVEKRL